jgi:hypothetical protein
MRAKCANLKITAPETCNIPELILKRPISEGIKTERIAAMTKWITDKFNMNPITPACQIITPTDSRWNPFYIIKM